MQKIFETPLYPFTRSGDQDNFDAGRGAARHTVVVVGAGPVGLALAIDLAMRDVPVLVVDENDRVSTGSRAICFAKRTLEIFDRLGCGDRMVEKGVTWNVGRVFRDEAEIYSFNLLAEEGHKRPAFINLQQYYLELILTERLLQLQSDGHAVELRGRTRLTAIDDLPEGARLTLETPEGSYQLDADWLVACDGARSRIRDMRGLEFKGRIFEDNFLIADIVMTADFPTERWFWFDPPFNRGQSALLHKQPDNVWRLDFQLGWDIDREAVVKPENVIPRVKAMLGPDVPFELEWVSVYTFQCCRMDTFQDGRIFFCGDSAHQVSPFGARGANSGIQDAENLAWKLAAVVRGDAPASLLDSYESERLPAADENILNSSRATDFLTPKSEMSRIFRDAVLDLSTCVPFAKALVNSGRLSTPFTYSRSPLFGPDEADMPARTRPGAPLTDMPIGNSWLSDQIGGQFSLLAIDTTIDAEAVTLACGQTLPVHHVSTQDAPLARNRYLGSAPSAVYLLRPDQHVVARWRSFDAAQVDRAVRASLGRISGG